MNRLEALERVAEAARVLATRNLGRVVFGWKELDEALRALDTLPPEPAGEVVEVEFWAHADGDVAVLLPGSAISRDWATNRFRTRLGTTRLVLAKEVPE